MESVNLAKSCLVKTVVNKLVSDFKDMIHVHDTYMFVRISVARRFSSKLYEVHREL